MDSLIIQYNKLIERYNIAYRCEISQKYVQAATAYLDLLTDGILFMEEHKEELKGKMHDELLGILKFAQNRMEYLKKCGYQPIIRKSEPTPIVQPRPIQPMNTMASIKPTNSQMQSHPGNLSYNSYNSNSSNSQTVNSPIDTPVQQAVTYNGRSINYDFLHNYASPSVKWEDIAGMKYAKKVLYETVILPSKRPDLFTGLRAPPKGILMFGPPGTGKTMLAKAVATESSALFFSISSSSLTSKWVGESEKIVRALFKVAYKNQPSIIFIDEIDSILKARSDNENEASRRLKTEFMIQLDGAATNGEERVLIMGATNRPFELDDAVIRRMARRVYIPLPDKSTRYELFKILLKEQDVDLKRDDIEVILDKTNLYSGSDIKVLCKEAAMGPIRDVNDLMKIEKAKIRPIQLKDFIEALKVCAPSVNPDSLQQYISWNDSYGSKGEVQSNAEEELEEISSAKDICRSY